MEVTIAVPGVMGKPFSSFGSMAVFGGTSELLVCDHVQFGIDVDFDILLQISECSTQRAIECGVMGV
jgi:hypothetical protein